MMEVLNQLETLLSSELSDSPTYVEFNEYE